MTQNQLHFSHYFLLLIETNNMCKFKTKSSNQFIVTVDIKIRPSDITYNDGGLTICQNKSALELYIKDVIEYLKNKYDIKNIKIKTETPSSNNESKTSIYKIDIFKGEQLVAHIITKEMSIHTIYEK